MRHGTAKTWIATFPAVALGFALVACQPSNPWVEYTPPPPEQQNVAAAAADQGTTTRRFDFFNSERTEDQKRFDQNEISVFFEVLKKGPNGTTTSVNGLKAQDFRVTENSRPVNPFELNSDVSKETRVVDIVFAIDITGTMVPLIESAKAGLQRFIETSRERGYHTRMCFVTFGDYTVQKCDRFYENDPKNPSSSRTQMKEFISRLSQIRAGIGPGQDPGWPDLDENPMGALLDAAKAPWGQDSQRFVILVTDWGFLYGPDNLVGEEKRNEKVERDPRVHIPTMPEVTAAIKAAQMKVFAVTRTQHDYKGKHFVWDGYNTPLNGEPGVVQSSGGEYFNFDDFLRKKITLNDVLEKILITVTTTYKITYVVDKVSGLDPTLPVDRRNVQIATADNDPQKTVKRNSVSSTMPRGREEYKDTWRVSDDAIQPGSLRVFVNGKELGPSEFSDNKFDVRFARRPNPGDKLRFVFRYAQVSKNLRLEPIQLFKLDPKSAKVLVNDVPARPEDYTFTKDLDGNTVLTLLAERALGEEDLYNAHRTGSLNVKVTSTVRGQ